MSVAAEKQTKRWTYEEYYRLEDGVKEYWIGDPANQTLETLTHNQGRYEILCDAAKQGKLHSLVLAGLEFHLEKIL